MASDEPDSLFINQSINQSRTTNHEPRLLLACLLIVFLITKAAPRRERCCIHDSVTCDFSLRVGETLTKSKRRTTKVAVSSKNREELSLLHVTCESQDSKSGPMDSCLDPELREKLFVHSTQKRLATLHALDVIHKLGEGSASVDVQRGENNTQRCKSCVLVSSNTRCRLCFQTR